MMKKDDSAFVAATIQKRPTTAINKNIQKQTNPMEVDSIKPIYQFIDQLQFEHCPWSVAFYINNYDLSGYPYHSHRMIKDSKPMHK